MEIAYLADYQHHIPQLAKWQHTEWAYLNPGDTLEKRTTRLHEDAQYCQIPTVIVAVEDDVLMGSASLVFNDMKTRAELNPWLASVYVDDKFRNRGIGSAVVQRIMEEARALGVRPLYLFTPDKQSFYTRLGWERVEDTEYCNEQVTIMRWCF